MAISSAIALQISVAVTRGSTPYDFCSKVGVQEVPGRNSQTLTLVKKSVGGWPSTTMMPPVVATDTMGGVTRSAWLAAPPGRRRPRRRAAPAAESDVACVDKGLALQRLVLAGKGGLLRRGQRHEA